MARSRTCWRLMDGLKAKSKLSRVLPVLTVARRRRSVNCCVAAFDFVPPPGGSGTQHRPLLGDGLLIADSVASMVAGCAQASGSWCCRSIRRLRGQAVESGCAQRCAARLGVGQGTASCQVGASSRMRLTVTCRRYRLSAGTGGFGSLRREAVGQTQQASGGRCRRSSGRMGQECGDQR